MTDARELVKPLVWEENEGNLPDQQVWSFDDTQTLWIVKNGDGDKFVLCENLTIMFVPASPVIGAFDSLEEAQKVGNEKHAARILSALNPAFLERVERLEALLKSAMAVNAARLSTYTARNGRDVSVEDENGEKLWLVPSDEMHELECDLAALSGEQSNAD